MTGGTMAEFGPEGALARPPIMTERQVKAVVDERPGAVAIN
jgi:hypothetical protein